MVTTGGLLFTNKWLPVMETNVPAGPVVGVNEVMTGGGKNVNPDLDAVPYKVVTVTSPEAPAPTMAVMVVPELTVNDVAATPPKVTDVAPVKFFPVRMTVSPSLAASGVNE